MNKLLFKKAVLVGTGMIGTSLGRDLLEKKMVGEITGVDISIKHLKLALKTGAISSWSRTLDDDLLRCCDVLILSLPVGQASVLLKKIAPRIDSKCLVIDVGSTKVSIVRLARNLFPRGNFVGCHPMAGSEKSGPEAGRKKLFEGKICFVVSERKKNSSMFKKTVSLWKKVGARVVAVSAKDHDKAVAAMSHLPHAVAFALARTLTQLEKSGRRGDLPFRQSAGGGVRDATRIAASSSQMWRDIFLDNQREILHSLDKFKHELNRLADAVARSDASQLVRFIEEAARWRRQLDGYEKK